MTFLVVFRYIFVYYPLLIPHSTTDYSHLFCLVNFFLWSCKPSAFVSKVVWINEDLTWHCHKFHFRPVYLHNTVQSIFRSSVYQSIQHIFVAIPFQCSIRIDTVQKSVVDHMLNFQNQVCHIALLLFHRFCQQCGWYVADIYSFNREQPVSSFL